MLDPPDDMRHTTRSLAEEKESDGEPSEERNTTLEPLQQPWDEEGLRLLDNIGDDQPLWEVFGAFKKVSSVDIAWLR